MSDNNLNRETLIKAASLVKPALATAEYIPAFTHLRFDGDSILAYNDVTSIEIAIETELEACIPGDLFIRTLNSFKAETVAVKPSGDGSIVVSSGRSKVKLPIMKLDDFPFDGYAVSKKDAIELEAGILKGIERCLISVGNDPTHPAQMGVTLDIDEEGRAVLFSTDNFTVSRYQTTVEIDLPGDSPVILPTFFCQQLVALSKAFPTLGVDLHILSDGLVAKIGKQATLTSKILSDLEPLDFPAIIKRNVKSLDIKETAIPIPPAWEGAFNRAMLVMSGEVDKATKITPVDGALKLASSSPMGVADDTLPFDTDPDDPFYIDPSLVLRVSSLSALAHLGPQALVLADESGAFMHLIAHCSK